MLSPDDCFQEISVEEIKIENEFDISDSNGNELLASSCNSPDFTMDSTSLDAKDKEEMISPNSSESGEVGRDLPESGRLSQKKNYCSQFNPHISMSKCTKAKVQKYYKQRTYSYIKKLKNTILKQRNTIRYLMFKLKKLENSSRIGSGLSRMQSVRSSLPVDNVPECNLCERVQSQSENNVNGYSTAKEIPCGDIHQHIPEAQSLDGCTASTKHITKHSDLHCKLQEVPFIEDMALNNLEIQMVESDTLDVTSSALTNKDIDGEEVDEELKKLVEDFMCREDVSVVDISMKYLRSGGRMTQFRRNFLSLLYKQFCAEVTSNCTFSQFRRYIPEYVIKPEPTFWKTIICSRCENAELKFVEVVTKILHRDDIFLEEVLIKQDLLDFVTQELDKLKSCTEPFTYMTWAKTLLGRMEANENIVTTTVGSACTDLLKELDLLKEHMNRCYVQFEAVREAREETEISPIHALVHIDWYESPAYFVARHLHTSYDVDGFKTLHTGYVRTKEKSYGFASLSDCKNLIAPAVWASVNDILVNLAKEGMKVITVVSDPSTPQYCNKGNFFLMRRFAKLNKVDLKWVYLEAGHGKGIAASVGAKVKDIMCDTIDRYKDKSFKYTADILPYLKDLTVPVRFFSHSENLVQQYKNLISRQHLQAIPRTSKVREVCVKETTFYVKESSADKLPFFSLDTKVRGITI